MKKNLIVAVAVVIAATSWAHRPHHHGFRPPPPPVHYHRPVHHCGMWRPALPRPAHCYADYWATRPVVTTTVAPPVMGVTSYGTPVQARQYFVDASGTIGQSVEAAMLSGQAAGGYAGVTTIVEPARANVSPYVTPNVWVSGGWQSDGYGTRVYVPGHYEPRRW